MREQGCVHCNSLENEKGHRGWCSMLGELGFCSLFCERMYLMADVEKRRVLFEKNLERILSTPIEMLNDDDKKTRAGYASVEVPGIP